MNTSRLIALVVVLAGCGSYVGVDEECEPEETELPDGPGPQGLETECGTSADCAAPDSFCVVSALGYPVNRCRPRGQSGAYCEADDWCGDELECSGSEHQCRRPRTPCTTHNDCGGHRMCNQDVGFCEKSRIDGEACKDHGWCSPGLACDQVEGVCVDNLNADLCGPFCGGDL